MKESVGSIFSATLESYRTCARSAFRHLVRNWIIIPASIAAWLVITVSSAFAAPFGIAGGFAIGILMTALLCFYYGWVQEIVQGSKLSWRGLLEFDWGLFFSIINVSFIIWVAELVIGSALLNPADKQIGYAFLRLIIVFAFNALPEVMYLERSEGIPAFKDALSFTKTHWIEWYLPFIIILLPFIAIDIQSIPLLLASTYPLLPVSPVFQATTLWFGGESSYLTAIAGVVVANWFVLFRAELFRDLSSGSRRKRAFLARQR